ncbi:MAG: hypothetical protein SOY94_06465, partial [Candidatus Limiplasma sp.]|nr:hypothetical protein [Candidatus Limiplasma sp.]
FLVVEKARLRRSFPPGIAPFAYTRRSPGGERRKETLLRKASETGVHAAGFGTRVGGLRPSKPPMGFIDSLAARPYHGRAVCVCYGNML